MVRMTEHRASVEGESAVLEQESIDGRAGQPRGLPQVTQAAISSRTGPAAHPRAASAARSEPPRRGRGRPHLTRKQSFNYFHPPRSLATSRDLCAIQHPCRIRNSQRLLPGAGSSFHQSRRPMRADPLRLKTVTHAVCVSMTGSGRLACASCGAGGGGDRRHSAIVIDPKGIVNLAHVSQASTERFSSGINEDDARKASARSIAAQQAEMWERPGLGPGRRHPAAERRGRLRDLPRQQRRHRRVYFKILRRRSRR